MTFKDLLLDAWAFTPLQGQPTSVTDPGLAGDLAKMLSSAWESIQDRPHDPKFRKILIEFQTQPGVTDYTEAMITVGSYPLEELKINTLYYNEKNLSAVSLEYFLLNNKTQGEPSFCTNEVPHDVLVKLNTPDKVYTINCIGYRGKQKLASDDDEVLIPGRHAGFIIHTALEQFAHMIGDQNLLYSSKQESRKARRDFMKEYSPKRKMKPQRFLV